MSGPAYDEKEKTTGSEDIWVNNIFKQGTKGVFSTLPNHSLNQLKNYINIYENLIQYFLEIESLEPSILHEIEI